MKRLIVLAIGLIIVFTFPAFAGERLCCKSDYTVRSLVDSEIIPGLKVDGPIKFKCPRCKTLNDDAEHGEIWKCSRCGLRIITWGNSIELLGD